MKQALLIALLATLSACVPITIIPDASPTPLVIVVTATPELSPSPRPAFDATPTQEIQAPLNCDSMSVSEGFYPINNNPCMLGQNFIRLDPSVRLQCIPNGYTASWDGHDAIGASYPAPFVDCETGGGMKLDLANRAGRFGLRFGMDNLIQGQCYLLKLTMLSDINRNAFIQNASRYSLNNFQFAGRLAATDSSTYDLTPQSPNQEDGRFEFIWAFHAASNISFEVWQDMLWADYSGTMIWKMIEVFAVNEGYCEGVTWYQ